MVKFFENRLKIVLLIDGFGTLTRKRPLADSFLFVLMWLLLWFWNYTDDNDVALPGKRNHKTDPKVIR
jgi:hypothetical protein